MKEKPRYKFIDYLRGWALLVMIEVHVFNSMLIPSIKTQQWFYILNFINGLVAPSFLFISGFAFIISSKRNLDELRSFGKTFWKKMGRIILIFAAGYSLHFPFRSVFILHHKPLDSEWLMFYNVDILQCIAVGLLVLFAARLLIKSDKFYDYFILILGLIIIFISPVIWQINFSDRLPLFFAAYFNTNVGSLFPLFPWLGFMFLGATACKYFLDFREKGLEKKYIYYITMIGILFLLIGHFIPLDFISPDTRYRNPNPLFLFLRVGYVLLLLVVCWFYAEFRRPEKSFVLDVSRESLFVYWLHLVLIYGMFWNGKSLYTTVDHTFGLVECILMTMAIAVLMIFAAKQWGNFKKRSRFFAKI